MAGISLDQAIQEELRKAAKARVRRRSKFELKMREGTMSKLYRARPQPKHEEEEEELGMNGVSMVG